MEIYDNSTFKILIDQDSLIIKTIVPPIKHASEDLSIISSKVPSLFSLEELLNFLTKELKPTDFKKTKIIHNVKNLDDVIPPSKILSLAQSSKIPSLVRAAKLFATSTPVKITPPSTPNLIGCYDITLLPVLLMLDNSQFYLPPNE